MCVDSLITSAREKQICHDTSATVIGTQNVTNVLPSKLLRNVRRRDSSTRKSHPSDLVSYNDSSRMFLHCKMKE